VARLLQRRALHPHAPLCATAGPRDRLRWQPGQRQLAARRRAPARVCQRGAEPRAVRPAAGALQRGSAGPLQRFAHGAAAAECQRGAALNALSTLVAHMYRPDREELG
jgi:hypothetical protein